MQNLGKLVTGSHLCGGNWKSQLNTLIRSYNSTPHSTTKVAPVVLMFNRSNFTKLPNIDLSELDWNKNLKIAIRNDNKSAIATETRCNDNLKFRKVDLKPGD